MFYKVVLDIQKVPVSVPDCLQNAGHTQEGLLSCPQLLRLGAGLGGFEVCCKPIC